MISHTKTIDEAIDGTGGRRWPEQHADEELAYARAIIATLRHPFVVLDNSLRIRSVNASFYRMFQVSEEGTLNHLIYELGNGQWNIPRLRTLLEKIVADSHTFEDFEVEHDFPNIGRRTLLLNARRVENGGSGGLILLAMEDVTARHAVEDALLLSEIRYRRLFQTAKDGILILDAGTGKILDANAFMSGLLGQELPELLGKELWQIGMFADIEENKAAFRELQERGYLRYEHLPVRNQRGETVEVEFVSNVYYEDRRAVAQCNVRDIAERSRMEREIKELAESLADQHRRKDEFLAMLSHELRNPLAPIRSATHLLRIQEGSENPIQKQAREVIERQVEHLTRLVSDLLELSRVVTGKIRIHLETVDMRQVVQHAMQMTAAEFERERSVVSLVLPPEPVWVNADTTRLEEVVVNLLSNAAKFTEDGCVEVTLEGEGDHVTLSVRDTGIGIAPEMLTHIFDLFTQADRSLDRSRGGLGIGLTVAHRLVKLHGGTVEARSAGLGEGSQFLVRLPVVPPPGQQPAPPAEQNGNAGGQLLRVLIVDDNVDACTMLAHLVRLHGYGVQMAYTGPAAIQAVSAWRPHVVLLDIGLPQLDGYEVARRLRADPALKEMKLVAVTGYGNEGDLQLARDAGFDAHLLKPVDLAAVARLLTAWSAARAAATPETCPDPPRR